VKVTIESPDLDFIYGDSDQYDAEIAGMRFFFIWWYIWKRLHRNFASWASKNQRPNCSRPHKLNTLTTFLPSCTPSLLITY